MWTSVDEARKRPRIAVQTVRYRAEIEVVARTTVAGAVVELFGRLPSTGEKLEHGGLEIEVLDADRRRVNRLRLKTLVQK